MTKEEKILIARVIKLLDEKRKIPIIGLLDPKRLKMYLTAHLTNTIHLTNGMLDLAQELKINFNIGVVLDDETGKRKLTIKFHK